MKNRNIEWWSIDTIKLKLNSLKSDDLIFILGPDSTLSSYLTFSKGDEISFSYYQEIFNSILQNYKPPIKTVEIDKTKTPFLKISEKIPLNFSNVQERAWEVYRSSYQYKSQAEKFIQERYKSDDAFKFGLQEEIHSSFCTIAEAPRFNYPVNQISVIEKMAQRTLKSEFQNHPQLNIMARGIIMYLFELCVFGARNVQEQQLAISPSLFDKPYTKS